MSQSHLSRRVASLRYRSLLSAIGLAWWVMIFGCAGSVCGQSFVSESAERTDVDLEFRGELRKIAAKCLEKDRKDLAKRTAEWQIRRSEDRQIVFVRGQHDPADSGVSEERSEGKADSVEEWWQGAMKAARASQARRLWELVDQALVDGHADRAMKLLYEILRENPDDRKASRALGLRERTRSRSRTQQGEKYSARKSRNAQQALGWGAGDYWRLQTDHFLITTNHSPDAAEKLGVILEEFHDIWQQLFVSFWTTPANVRQAVNGRGIQRRTSGKHKVVLFANQKEYADHLVRLEPQARMTLGIYRPNDRTAYFFANDDKVSSGSQLSATWRHEAAHQLFFESTRRGHNVGDEHGFWLVEGLAIYLESLKRQDGGFYSLGGFESERLQFARYRALQEGFYVPLEELSGMGRIAMQQDSRIRRLYSQSCGLVHFLMDADGGKYRSGLVEYAKLLYHGQAKLETLPSVAKSSFKELDGEYRSWLRVSDEQLLRLPTWAQPAKLCLGSAASEAGGEPVTDKGLMRLAGQRELTWLDLTNCPVSDEGILALSDELPVTQLNLESTGITDLSMAKIAQWKTLEELDLSGTDITDQALVAIARLPKLRVLWLTGTSVTDSGLQRLDGLRNLEVLDVSQTEVTATEWEAFKSQHPKLAAKTGS